MPASVRQPVNGGCPAISGWPGEEVQCVRKPWDHDGYHQFPHTPVRHEVEEEIVETIIKLIIDSMKQGIEHQKVLIAEIEKSLKASGIGEQPPPVPRKRRKDDAVPALPEQPAAPVVEEKTPGFKVEDITIEMLREMATKYSSAFGMGKLIELNLKHGGAKKLSGVDPKMYGVLWGAMGDELAKAGTSAPKANGETVITIEQLREKAATFLTANGQPALLALLKAHGAEKISGLAKDKYAAFIEAIDNA